LSAHKMGLLFALYIGVNLVSGQIASAAPDTNLIGKVLVATGTIRIDHPGVVTVQANLPTNNVAQAKVGDFIYRGDIIQTDQTVRLVLASPMAVRLASPPMRVWRWMTSFMIPMATPTRA